MATLSAKSNSGGLNAAYGRRRLTQAKLRLLAYRAVKYAGMRPSDSFPDYLEFAPAVRNAKELTDLSARVSCYLGDTGLALYLPPTELELDPTAVPHFDPDLVRDPGWTHQRPSGTSHLVIHRLTPATLRRHLLGGEPSTVVDPNLHANSEGQYFGLRASCSWPTYEPVEIGLERLRALRPNVERASAFVLATGPSASGVDVAQVDADIRITCNSAVRDLDRMRVFRPNIITFMDPVFHLGPSRYAGAFRRDVLRAVEELDPLVVCGDMVAGPLLGLLPQLKGRLVVIPHQTYGAWRWPTDRNPTVRHGGNVLVGLMLPLALMLADDISIAGADGRQSSEKYYWQHSPALQYSDEMMRSVFDSHPAFFRDRDYEDYYDEHCQNMEALISVGEECGKTVRCVTSSWIPALRKRGAPAP